MINSFRGEHFFLSNFYEVPIEYNGITYRCAEAAFQAQKDLKRSEEFSNLSGKAAKALGYKVNLRKDWESVKDSIMRKIIIEKFKQNPDILKQLRATGTEDLIEGNSWGDRYWGVCNGVGKNKLGNILMDVRAILS